MIGTGGLSHWLFVPRMGEVAVEFDRMVMREIAAGRAEQLSQADGGGDRRAIRQWRDRDRHLADGRGDDARPPGVEIFYEPMPEWLTGMGGMAIPA